MSIITKAPTINYQTQINGILKYYDITNYFFYSEITGKERSSKKCEDYVLQAKVSTNIVVYSFIEQLHKLNVFQYSLYVVLVTYR